MFSSYLRSWSSGRLTLSDLSAYLSEGVDLLFTGMFEGSLGR
jgi:hypothetical protein